MELEQDILGERSSREMRKASRRCPPVQPGALPATGLGEETRVGKGTEDGPREEQPSAKKVI